MMLSLKDVCQETILIQCSVKSTGPTPADPRAFPPLQNRRRHTNRYLFFFKIGAPGWRTLEFLQNNKDIIHAYIRRRV
jgi:hypothetical protein